LKRPIYTAGKFFKSPDQWQQAIFEAKCFPTYVLSKDFGYLLEWLALYLIEGKHDPL
jgi:hypothetical protein